MNNAADVLKMFTIKINIFMFDVDNYVGNIYIYIQKIKREKQSTLKKVNKRHLYNKKKERTFEIKICF